ncbi:MAG: AAA family ATPase [Symploca sp. SIO2D2]|nr:AAA family ATPase [Symploca sp. SIO2D2]
MIGDTLGYNSLPQLPQANIDAEEAVLGGILFDPGAIDRVKNILQPKHFYSRHHGEIYRASLSTADKSGCTDLMTVTTYLFDRKQLDDVGGQPRLAQLYDRTVSTANIDEHATLIVDKYKRRLLQQIGYELVNLANETFVPTKELCERVEDKLQGWRDVEANSKSKLDLLIEEMERVQLKIELPEARYWELLKLSKKYNLTTKQLQNLWDKHLISLDHEPVKTWAELLEHEQEFQEWLLQGFIPRKSLVLLHAPGGTGKTRLLYDWMACLLQGQSWSQTPDWNGFPVTSRKRRVLIIQTDETRPEMVEALKIRGFNETLDVRFLTNWSVDLIPQLTNIMESFQPEAVLVDSLSSVNRNSLVSENDVEYAKPVLTLRFLADRYNSTFFLIHHSNKQNEVRGSSAIRAAASMVMSLERDPLYSEPDSGHRLLTITKSRARRPATYSVEADFETGQWTLHGEKGFIDTELTTKSKILQLLTERQGVRFEIEELAYLLDTTYEVSRKNLSALARDGIISKIKIGRRLKYFIQLSTTEAGNAVGNPEAPPQEDCDRLLPPDAETVVGNAVGNPEAPSQEDCGLGKSLILPPASFSPRAESKKKLEEVGTSGESPSNPNSSNASGFPTPPGGKFKEVGDTEWNEIWEHLERAPEEPEARQQKDIPIPLGTEFPIERVYYTPSPENLQEATVIFLGFEKSRAAKKFAKNLKLLFSCAEIQVITENTVSKFKYEVKAVDRVRLDQLRKIVQRALV